MTDLERVLDETVGLRFHQTLDVTDAAFDLQHPPSFQLVSARATFLMLPYMVNGDEMRVEVFGFDADGHQRLHQHLTLI